MPRSGFSARGRGESKPITNSLLPLQAEKAHASSSASTRLLRDLPTPPPLPPLPSRIRDKIDDTSSYKVPNHKQSNLNPNSNYSTEITSVSTTSIPDAQFEGETSPQDSSLHRLTNSPLSDQIHPSLNNLSNQTDNYPPIHPSYSQGTDLYYLLGFHCQYFTTIGCY